MAKILILFTKKVLNSDDFSTILDKLKKMCAHLMASVNNYEILEIVGKSNYIFKTSKNCIFAEQNFSVEVFY